MTATAPDVALDLDHARHWLERAYTDTPGRLSIVHMDAGGTFRGTGGDVPDVDAALERITRLDQANPRGIYLRTTTLGRQLEPHERGAATDSHALPGLWADVDFGIEGHKPGRGLPLPPDAAEAWRIVNESGLPAPSLWVHSGGGLYPWWLLDQPLVLDDTTGPHAMAASTAWQQILKRAAERLGYDYGAGVGDLSRVLRIPGTVNRKTDTPRPCRIVEDDGTVYTFDELLAAIAANAAPEPKPSAPATRPVGNTDPLGIPRTGATAFDLLDEHVTFDDILTSAGWERCTNRHGPNIEACWNRPGHTSPCSAHTLTANPHVLVVFSEGAGLPTGGDQRLTRGRLFAHLHHRGDERAAALDLFDAINGRHATQAAAALPLPRSAPPVTQTPQPWRDVADFEEHALRVERDRRDAPTDATAPSEPWQEHESADVDPDAAVAAHFEHAVTQEAERLRIREAARARLQEEEADVIELPPLVRLDEFLAIPDPEITHRISGLWPSGGRVVLAAPPKAGKTTTVGNLLRALADGDPFLNEHPTTQAGRVVLLDNELDEDMLRRWLRDHNITNTDRIELAALRGRLSTFNILDPATRTRWAQSIGPGDVLVFDCLRPALDALALSEDKDAGRFLEALDELTQEAGIPETLVIHHMGHSGERSRGDSRIIDWPDATWRLIKDAEDEEDAPVRRVYFTANGRDVDQPEQLLAFNPDTRHLSVAGGTRRDTRSDELTQPILTYLADNPGASGNAIEKAVEGKAAHIRKALKEAVGQGLVDRRQERRGNFYTLTSSPSSHLVPDEGDEPPRAPRPLVYRTRDEDEDPDDPTTAQGRGRTKPHLQRRIVAGQEQWIDPTTGEVHDSQESA